MNKKIKFTMEYTIFDQDGYERRLNNMQYLTHLLMRTQTELRDHFLIQAERRIQSEHRTDKKELKFRNWTNKYKLRFLIYDFIELKECKNLFFKNNTYIIEKHINLLTKTLNCKHRNCEHPLLYRRNYKTQYDNYYFP